MPSKNSSINSAASNKDVRKLPPILKAMIWMRGLEITANKFSLLALLLMYSDVNHRCYPGQRLLARTLGVSERTIRRWMVFLVEKGLISVTTNIKNGHKHNVYELKVGMMLPDISDSNDRTSVTALQDKLMSFKEDIEDDSNKIPREKIPRLASTQSVQSIANAKQDKSSKEEEGDIGYFSNSSDFPSEAWELISKYVGKLHSNSAVVKFWFSLLRMFHPNAPASVLNLKKLPASQLEYLMSLLWQQGLNQMIFVTWMVIHWHTILEQYKKSHSGYKALPKFPSLSMFDAVFMVADEMFAISLDQVERFIDLLENNYYIKTQVMTAKEIIALGGWYNKGEDLFKNAESSGLLTQWVSRSNVRYMLEKLSIPPWKVPVARRDEYAKSLDDGCNKDLLLERMKHEWEESFNNSEVQYFK